ncbi:hypothetical protein Tco_1178599 [Tanacetum coccineum]
MWNLRRIMELQASAQSTTWSDVLSLYFWRAKEADLRLARMINNVSVKLRAAIEEYQLFTQELEASPGWVVNKDRSIEYLQELVQRDEEMVQRLQALEREVEERADEKMLFIEKLKGNLTHWWSSGISPWLRSWPLELPQLAASPGWVVNNDRLIKYLQELVQRDEEMVQRLQALEREVEDRADEKMLFIENLKGNVPFE